MMRNSKVIYPVIALLFLLTTSFISTAKGTEPGKKVVYIEITLADDSKIGFYGNGLELLTPSSNFLKTYKFEVPDELLEQIDFGIYANYIAGVKLELESGEILKGAGFLNKAGNLNFTLHKNGAGRAFPKGWF